MNFPQQIRPGQMYQGSKPVRDPAYLRFIKRLPCVVCLQTWWIDPAHGIPLCRKHHAEFDECPWKFANRYSLDIPALITMFTHFYSKEPAQVRKEAA